MTQPPRDLLGRVADPQTVLRDKWVDRMGSIRVEKLEALEMLLLKTVDTLAATLDHGIRDERRIRELEEWRNQLEGPVSVSDSIPPSGVSPGHSSPSPKPQPPTSAGPSSKKSGRGASSGSGGSTPSSGG